MLHELGSGEWSDSLDLGIFIEGLEFLSCAVPRAGLHETKPGSPSAM